MEWYYTKDGVQVGPVSQDELIHMISVGEVSSNQMAWHDGLADWQPISSIPELQITAGAGQVAPPTLVPGSPVPPAAMVQPAKTSGLAIASVCLAAGSFVLCGIFMSIPAVICGHMALAEIKRSGNQIEGKAMAIIGLVLGYLMTLLSIVALFFFFFVMSAAGTAISEESSYGEKVIIEDVLENLDSLPDIPEE